MLESSSVGKEQQKSFQDSLRSGSPPLRTRSNYLRFDVECDNSQTDEPKIDWRSEWSGDVAAFRYPSLHEKESKNTYKLKWQVNQTPSPSKIKKLDKNSVAAKLSAKGDGERCLRVKEEQTHKRGLKKNVQASDVWEHGQPMHIETDKIYKQIVAAGKKKQFETFAQRRLQSAVGKLSNLNEDEKLDLQMHIPKEAAMDRSAVQYYRRKMLKSNVKAIDALSLWKQKQRVQTAVEVDPNELPPLDPDKLKARNKFFSAYQSAAASTEEDYRVLKKVGLHDDEEEVELPPQLRAHTTFVEECLKMRIGKQNSESSTPKKNSESHKFTKNTGKLIMGGNALFLLHSPI